MDKPDTSAEAVGGTIARLFGGPLGTDRDVLIVAVNQLARLLAERDAYKAGLEKIAVMNKTPMYTTNPDFGDGYDMAAGSAAETALDALAEVGL